jgi:tripartite-type tricarboxylate transporter receptor subunit TctC/nitrite reductase/ring-hydroxylating ferredoxin subunit
MRMPPLIANVAALLIGCVAAATAAAQAYPAKPVRMIVGYPPGGFADLAARPMAQKLTELWGQSVVIENRSGASGMIGADLVAKSQPDGYTLLLGAASEVAVNVHLFKSMSYDPLADLQPITQVAIAPLVLTVHPSLQVKSIQELVAVARTKPGGLSYASIGKGTPHHFAGELMNKMLNIKLVHVPYKGGGPALTDLIGGHVMMGFVALTSALQNVKQGKLNALAVTSMQRVDGLNVPTLNESGLPGFDVTQWLAIFTTAKTPADIVNKLNRDVVSVVRSADFRQRMTDLGTVTVGGSVQDLARLQASEIEKYRSIAASAGIVPESRRARMGQESANIIYSRVAKTGDVKPGSPLQVELGDAYIALFNLEGKFYAIEAYCTHALAALVEGRVQGENIECPLHAALFSIKTGEVVREPATEGLKTYPVRVENGDILVGIPE